MLCSLRDHASPGWTAIFTEHRASDPCCECILCNLQPRQTLDVKMLWHRRLDGAAWGGGGGGGVRARLRGSRGGPSLDRIRGVRGDCALGGSPWEGRGGTGVGPLCCCCAAGLCCWAVLVPDHQRLLACKHHLMESDVALDFDPLGRGGGGGGFFFFF